jgi:hypothetical protein
MDEPNADLSQSDVPIDEQLVDDADIRSIRSFLKAIFQDLRSISMETKFSSYR